LNGRKRRSTNKKDEGDEPRQYSAQGSNPIQESDKKDSGHPIRIEDLPKKGKG